MRSFSRSQDDETFRAKAGLPITHCPNCGSGAPHWIAESLGRPGRYTCDDKFASSQEPPALDLEWGDLTGGSKKEKK